MELIHLNESLKEIQRVHWILSFEAGVSSDASINNNDFELQLSEKTWIEEPIRIGHFLNCTGTEFGGRVTDLEHTADGKIKLTGLTWRGLLAKQVIKPPPGAAYLRLQNIDLLDGIRTLIGDRWGGLIEGAAGSAGVLIKEQYRYRTVLDALEHMVRNAGYRLTLIFDGQKVTIGAVPVSDLSADLQIDDDCDVPMSSVVSTKECYNHVIALGKGELLERQVLELWISESGTITDTGPVGGVDDLMGVYDYSSVESLEELRTGAIQWLKDHRPNNRVSADLTAIESAALGDIVGGVDRITGLSIKAPVTKITYRAAAAGEKYTYEIGGK